MDYDLFRGRSGWRATTISYNRIIIVNRTLLQCCWNVEFFVCCGYGPSPQGRVPVAPKSNFLFFFIPITPKLPRAKCTSNCPRMLCIRYDTYDDMIADWILYEQLVDISVAIFVRTTTHFVHYEITNVHREK
jgi:hypothetical protein